MAGSLHSTEYDFFLTAAKKVSQKNKKTKFIIVPRTNANGLCSYLNEQKIDFETDEKITGKSRYLVIKKMGILDRLYSICDVAVVGDTFPGAWGSWAKSIRTSILQ